MRSCIPGFVTVSILILLSSGCNPCECIIEYPVIEGGRYERYDAYAEVDIIASRDASLLTLEHYATATIDKAYAPRLQQYHLGVGVYLQFWIAGTTGVVKDMYIGGFLKSSHEMFLDSSGADQVFTDLDGNRLTVRVEEMSGTNPWRMNGTYVSQDGSEVYELEISSFDWSNSRCADACY